MCGAWPHSTRTQTTESHVERLSRHQAWAVPDVAGTSLPSQRLMHRGLRVSMRLWRLTPKPSPQLSCSGCAHSDRCRRHRLARPARAGPWSRAAQCSSHRHRSDRSPGRRPTALSRNHVRSCASRPWASASSGRRSDSMPWSAGRSYGLCSSYALREGCCCVYSSCCLSDCRRVRAGRDGAVAWEQQPPNCRLGREVGLWHESSASRYVRPRLARVQAPASTR